MYYRYHIETSMEYWSMLHRCYTCMELHFNCGRDVKNTRLNAVLRKTVLRYKHGPWNVYRTCMEHKTGCLKRNIPLTLLERIFAQ